MLPLPVSALLAAAACVVAGVAPASEVFRPFSQPLVFLFIGSFILAEAIRIHRTRPAACVCSSCAANGR